MPRESQKPAPENTEFFKPFGKKTVIPTDRNAAPIRPITAGLPFNYLPRGRVEIRKGGKAIIFCSPHYRCALDNE